MVPLRVAVAVGVSGGRLRGKLQPCDCLLVDCLRTWHKALGRDHKFQRFWPERKHGLFTKKNPVSAHVGSSKNLKNLKDLKGTPSEIDRAPAVRQGVGSVCWATLQPVVGRRRKSRRMWGLQRARNARNWRSGLGAQRPAVGNASCRFHSTRKGWSETATRCQSPRDRRLLLAPSLTTRAMDGESAHPCF